MLVPGAPFPNTLCRRVSCISRALTAFPAFDEVAGRTMSCDHDGGVVSPGSPFSATLSPRRH